MLSNLPPVTKALLIANALVFLLQQFLLLLIDQVLTLSYREF